LRTSNREWILVVAAIASLAPLPAAAETYGFKIEKEGAGLTCSRDDSAKADAPPEALVVKLTRPPDAAQGAELATRSAPEAPPGRIAPQPGATKTAVEWKVLKSMASGLTLFIRDPKNDKLRCPEVPQPGAGTGASDRKVAEVESTTAGGKPADVEIATWWQQNRTNELEKLRKGSGYPASTQFLVHYDNGEPAPPFSASLTERAPIQIAVIARPGTTPALTLSVTSCEKVVPFRIREPAPAGAPQAKELKPPPVLVAYGPLLRCGAGTFSYSLGIDGSSTAHSLRVRPVSHLAFTTAYGFDFTRVPSFAVENGKVARTSDRAGFGLRLGATWFPLGIDYEDMKPWNYVNPMFAFDPVSPTENFLVGGAITPTGGLALLVGANFRRRTALRGTTVGADITGTEVPTSKEWTNNGIGLYVGLSVDDDVFQAIKGRLGR
jgi:hypothetical protein